MFFEFFSQRVVDFQSLGSLLFFMITGANFVNTPEVYEKLSEFNESSVDLLRKLINADSNISFNGIHYLKSKKFNISDIKSHPFYTAEFHDEVSFCQHNLTELYESLIDQEDFNSSLFEQESDFDVGEENDENNENVFESCPEIGKKIVVFYYDPF